MKLNLSFILLFISTSIFAQNNFAGGEYIHQGGECVPESEYTRINQMLTENIQMLRAQGLLSTDARNTVEYQLPLNQASGFSYNEIYGISNFVDHDEEYSSDNDPTTITDYNCQSRSYDTGDGYNHSGIDYFTWPFGWKMMEEDHGEIVAIADGVIVGKDDGNNDQSCSFNGSYWNAVYVIHEDNSVSWYGHMKENSLTTKEVGDAVVAGEYLGIIGSSGNSTGPHLHLEIYKNGDLIDPYLGECNPTIAESCWEDQRPYREPTINVLLTHDADPGFLDCPSPTQQVENHNIQNCFQPGQAVYFAAYYHDQLANDPAQYRVTMPGGTIYQNWSHSSTQTYNASYWYWWWTLPINAPEGNWLFEVTYGGETVAHNFTVGNVLSTGLNGPSMPSPETPTTYSTPIQSDYTYEWTVINGTIIEGQGTAEVVVEWDNVATGTICVTNINPNGCTAPTACLDVELDVVSVNELEALSSFEVSPNPNNGQFLIQLDWQEPLKNISINLLNVAGQEVLNIFKGNIPSGQQTLSVDSKLESGIYLLQVKNEKGVNIQKVLVQ